MTFFALLAILTHPGWLLQLWASGFGILSGAGVNLKLTPEQYRKLRRIDESPFTFPFGSGTLVLQSGITRFQSQKIKTVRLKRGLL
jgi:hypothetical protein